MQFGEKEPVSQSEKEDAVASAIGGKGSKRLHRIEVEADDDGGHMVSVTHRSKKNSKDGYDHHDYDTRKKAFGKGDHEIMKHLHSHLHPDCPGDCMK